MVTHSACAVDSVAVTTTTITTSMAVFLIYFHNYAVLPTCTAPGYLGLSIDTLDKWSIRFVALRVSIDLN